MEQTETARAAFDLAVAMHERGFDLGLSLRKEIPKKDHTVWKQSDETKRRFEANSEEANKSRRHAIAVLEAIHCGFVRFCRTAGLEANQILSWSKPILVELENATPLLDQDIPFDHEIEEAAYKKFISLWPEH